MNISYLLSVLDLYLMKEKDGQMVIEVDNQEEIVKVQFCYSFDTSNRTFVKLSKEMFFKNIQEFIKKVQGNLMIEKEKKETLKTQEAYIVVFSNKRKLSFVNFSQEEMKLIRSNLSSSLPKEEVELEVSTFESYDTELNKRKNTRFAFSMGFSSYVTLLITSIWFLDIFMIALWIFKAFIR